MEHLIDLGIISQEHAADVTEGDTSTDTPNTWNSVLTGNLSSSTQLTDLSLAPSLERCQGSKVPTSNVNASQLGLLRFKEEELKIKKERLRLRDEQLEIDLELAETRRKLMEAELGITNSRSRQEDRSPRPNSFVNPAFPQQMNTDTVQSSQVPQHLPCDEAGNFIQAMRPTMPAAATAPDSQVQDWSYAFQALADGMQLPPREVKKFAGDPLDYHRFITDFDDNISSRVKDPMTKLTYIISHCIGQAYEAIQSTIIIRPPEKAFQTARTILEEQFGQQYKVVAAHMKVLKDGPRIREGDADSLYKLATQMRNCHITLTEWGYSANLNNYDTIDKIFLRLPLSQQRDFQKKTASTIAQGKEPDFKVLMDFVQQQAMMSNTRFGQMLHARKTDTDLTHGRKSQAYNFKPSAKDSHGKGQGGMKMVHATEVSSKESVVPVYKCAVCSQAQPLWKCPEFIKRTVKERLRLVSEAHLCFNCLRSNGHLARKCPTLGRCKVESCGRRHHTLLHYSVEPPPSTTVESVGNTTVTSTLQFKRKARLKVLPVEVTSPQSGLKVNTYAFLDDGSNATLCTTRLMRRLQVQGEKEGMRISTIFGQRQQTIFKLDLNVKGVEEEARYLMKNVYALPSLPDISNSIVKGEDIAGLRHLTGINFPTLPHNDVDMLIGMDNIECLLVDETKVGKENEPLGLHTGLGWTLAGNTQSGKEGSVSVHFTSLGHNRLIHDQLNFMFSNDFCGDVSDTGQSLSVEDVQALDKMDSSVKRVDGHYELALPWRTGCPSLPYNRPMAEKRVDSLRMKLLRDPDLFDLYKSKMSEYSQRNFIRKVPDDSSSSVKKVGWYIPHHATTQTKFRIVFDCAAKFGHTSLNEQLLKGPDHTNNLVGVLLRFRQERYAFSCDINSMFHQVKVTPSDCDYLKFLWFENNNLSSSPIDYQLLVHPFGATSSPSIAGYALRKVGRDNLTNASDDTIKTVKNNFYVDDCLKSLSSAEAARSLITELQTLVESGGFHLSKFNSSCRVILFSVPDADRSVCNVIDVINELPISKTLGLIWNTSTDTLQIRVNIKEKPCTRRGLLSIISQVYDPLGLVQPFILPMKRHLQVLNCENLSWDDPLPDLLRADWDYWLSQLPSLQDIAISRCYKPIDFDIVRTELHCFSDASEVGYGAVTYLRMVSASQEVHCSFVLGRSRVAPLKLVTIPRLELTAAVVAVRLVDFILHELEYKVDAVQYWCDSTAVLQYIANTSKRFRPFVGNRLKIIHDLSKVEQWRYVDTKSNPADLASRGAYPNKCAECETWFKGPSFLYQPEHCWPSCPAIPSVSSNDPEVKKVNLVGHTQVKDQSTEVPLLQELFSHYSSWHRLVKAVAWLNKYKQFLKTKYLLKRETPIPHQISVEEYESAAVDLIKCIQQAFFGDEMIELQSSNHLNITKRRLRASPTLHVLQRLTPFVKNGILRVGGRLQRSYLPQDMVHPIILPSTGHGTALIVQHYHEREGHSGTLHVLAALREKYWILRGQATVRKVLQRCAKCRLDKARPGEQIEAPLPECRVTPNHPPFSWTGVDYMGPIMVRQGRNTLKRYISVFTCMASRAVHLEVANSLDTSSFLMAFHRFVGGRGKPAMVLSDNGTNFVGAERELKDALKSWDINALQSDMLKLQITWRFNPPAASHQGGIWERIIRTVRKVLYALTRDRVLDDESLHSFIVEVEQIINNRPITPLSSDPSDAQPLTPKMLLTGRLQSDTPPGQFIKADGYRKSWKLVQFLADQFWSQWLKLYIQCLQPRQKWLKPYRSLAIGDVVLIADDNVSRGNWPKGIVEEVLPDKEGRVRRVRVRTSSSSMTRDVRKLCLLEARSA